jgi:Uma2 family endonuclease
MSIALSIEPIQFVLPPHKRWTRTECETLARVGLIESERYELIQGELIDTMGKNQPHIIWLAIFHEWCRRFFVGRVLTEAVLDVSPEDEPTNEPQPDLLVLHSPFTSFLARRPAPADVALLVEIADSTFSFDTTVRAGLYARAGIADYWVVDVQSRQIIVFREPRDGEYRAIAFYKASDRLSPLAAPDASLSINEILPPEN